MPIWCDQAVCGFTDDDRDLCQGDAAGPESPTDPGCNPARYVDVS